MQKKSPDVISEPHLPKNGSNDQNAYSDFKVRHHQLLPLRVMIE